MHGSYADDGASDRVGCADWDPSQSGGEQSYGAGGFGAESADRLQFGDTGAHGVDDAPPTEVGAQSDGGVGREDDRPVVVSPTALQFGSTEDLGAEQRTGDDAHGFLSIVAAVAEAVGSGGEQLQAAEPGVDALRRLAAKNPENRGHEQERENEANDRGDHDEDEGLIPSGGDDDRKRTGTHDGGPGHATNESVRGGCGQAPPPRKQVPNDGAEQAADDDVLRHSFDVNHAAADGIGDGGAEQEGGNEVKESGPNYGQFGRQDPG